VSFAAGDQQNIDVWVLEFARGVMTRFTFDPKDDGMPLWSPDSRQIAFYSNRTGARQIYLKDAGGGGREEQLTTDAGNKFPTDWSPDGRFVLYVVPAGNPGSGLWALPVDGDRKPIAVDMGLRVTPGANAQFSPDGKWIAYTSNESGRSEVYVRSFPKSVSQWQVSAQGGSAPKWRADGKEMFHLGLERDSILAAAVRGSGGTFQSDTPRELFRVSRLPDRIASPYEVTADGGRFLLLEPTDERTEIAPLTVVLNWQAGLKQ
jgi:dipeptidyl aminopeptidase/acylaminoacyl peptidase